MFLTPFPKSISAFQAKSAPTVFLWFVNFMKHSASFSKRLAQSTFDYKNYPQMGMFYIQRLALDLIFRKYLFNFLLKAPKLFLFDWRLEAFHTLAISSRNNQLNQLYHVKGYHLDFSSNLIIKFSFFLQPFMWLIYCSNNEGVAS